MPFEVEHITYNLNTWMMVSHLIKTIPVKQTSLLPTSWIITVSVGQSYLKYLGNKFLCRNCSKHIEFLCLVMYIFYLQDLN